jgi:hypothetical protein
MYIMRKNNIFPTPTLRRYNRKHYVLNQYASLIRLNERKCKNITEKQDVNNINMVFLNLDPPWPKSPHKEGQGNETNSDIYISSAIK